MNAKQLVVSFVMCFRSTECCMYQEEKKNGNTKTGSMHTDTQAVLMQC